MGKSKKSVVIIDDDQNLVISLSELVISLGMDVVGTGINGKEAVSLYHIHKPDLVMLDIIMDDYDGFYAIREIQKLNSNTKFIVMSSFDSQKAYDDVLNLGIKTLIRKPITIEKIKDVINN